MDNLLCDESWLLSCPSTPEPLPNLFRRDNDVAMMFPAMSPAMVEEAFSMDLKKESCFSNYGDKFIEFLVSKRLIDSRFQAVQWLIQTRSRLNLSYETLFSAANCFDRFVCVTNCYEWTKWMVELVVLTSLSIASKFNEVMSPSLQEFQMEGLNHIFHQKTVLEMELIVLKALEWRVNSVTSYSFSQILTSKIGLAGDGMIMNRITDHLLNDLCDLKMLKYPPSVVAVSAVWKLLEAKEILDDNLGSIINLFGQEHKENIVKCIDVMKSRNIDHWWSKRKSCEVMSSVYMWQRGDIMNLSGDYCFEDLSAIFQIFRSEGSKNKKKRDGESYEDSIRPAKKMTIVMSN